MRMVCDDLCTKIQEEVDDSDDGPDYWCRDCRKMPEIKEKRDLKKVL